MELATNYSALHLLLAFFAGGVAGATIGLNIMSIRARKRKRYIAVSDDRPRIVLPRRYALPMRKPQEPRAEVIRDGSDKVRFLNQDGTVTDE